MGSIVLPMRILIPGGFGFVGSRLATHLACAGHRVVLGTRKALPPPEWLPKAEVRQIDWDDTASIRRSCLGIDTVVHAGGMNAQDCTADPAAALAINGLATTRLVWSAVEENVNRFIYISTAHVYASPLTGTITEQTCPNNLHPYATSHLAGEMAVLHARQQGRIQGIVLRLSNAFGAPMDTASHCWTLFVNDLCRQAVLERTMRLRTSGMQLRDFVGLSEVCRISEKLILGMGDSVPTGIFNVGSGKSLTLLEMAGLIRERCGLLFGYEPELQAAPVETNEKQEHLSFRIENLASIGIDVTPTDTSEELDQLLRYCKNKFLPANCE